MKGQGLSLNTMAIAVLVILVIVVLAYILSDIVGDTVPPIKAQATCEAQPGNIGCYETSQECKADGGSATLGLGCEAPTRWCCIRQGAG